MLDAFTSLSCNVLNFNRKILKKRKAAKDQDLSMKYMIVDLICWIVVLCQ